MVTLLIINIQGYAKKVSQRYTCKVSLSATIATKPLLYSNIHHFQNKTISEVTDGKKIHTQKRLENVLFEMALGFGPQSQESKA
jgi:hypothetical protein